MRFVQKDKLQEDMITARSIYDYRGVLTLAANHKLTKDTIYALQRSSLRGIFVYDDFTEFEHLNDLIDDSLRHDIVSNLQDFNIDQVVYLANQIVDALLAKPDLVVDLNALALYDNGTYQHSIDVAVMSVTCGVGSGLGNQELDYLAQAGVLHDIGKRAIPKEIIEKPGALTEEEIAIIHKHPKLGYDMLYDNRNISAHVRRAILAHHENWDGSGYPLHLSEYDIPLLARIIHVVDVYDALVKERPYKHVVQKIDAIEYLMAHCNDYFDIDVVNVFLKYLVVYPVGTDVQLSDGRIARVIKNRSSSIMRPVVMTREKQVLDLAKDFSCLNIVIIGEVDE